MVKTAVLNSSETSAPVSVSASLLDAQGTAVGDAASITVQVGAGSETETELSISVAGPRKWSAEDPYLYKLLLTLRILAVTCWR